MLSESAYNITHTEHIRIVNLTVVLVKIAGSFPFSDVVQPEEICKALASVVAMVISCKYFKFHVIHPPSPFFFY